MISVLGSRIPGWSPLLNIDIDDGKGGVVHVLYTVNRQGIHDDLGQLLNTNGVPASGSGQGLK